MFRKLAISIALSITLFTPTLTSYASSASTHTKPWYAPLLTLHQSWQPAVRCLILKESRSTEAHPNLGDDNGNGENTLDGQSSGIFQMNNGSNGVWDLYAKPRLHVDISRATAYQQAEGFVDVLRFDGGFHPWHGDGCVYPN